MYVLVLSTSCNLLVPYPVGRVIEMRLHIIEKECKLVSSRSWPRNFDSCSELQKNIHAFVESFSLE